jgi:hypothetical protein
MGKVLLFAFFVFTIGYTSVDPNAPLGSISNPVPCS